MINEDIRHIHRLTRPERLTRRDSFAQAFKSGKRVRLPGFTVILVSNQLPYRRLGMSVGRKFGNAVKRNRAKRIIRELFRTYKDLFPPGRDVIIVPYQGFLERDRDQHWKNLRRAFGAEGGMNG